jgi:hypothetical protein
MLVHFKQKKDQARNDHPDISAKNTRGAHPHHLEYHHQLKPTIRNRKPTGTKDDGTAAAWTCRSLISTVIAVQLRFIAGRRQAAQVVLPCRGAIEGGGRHGHWIYHSRR